MNDDESARARIAEVIGGWAVWRDAGLWTELLTAWHPDGRMHSSWFRGSAPDFVAACRRGFEAGALVHHSLGGSWITVHGTRAITQTKVIIGQLLLVCSGVDAVKVTFAASASGEGWIWCVGRSEGDLRSTPSGPRTPRHPN